MNQDDILKMPAGREMDALIGETFGAEPEVLWAIGNKEGTGFYDIRDNKWVAEKQLSESPWLIKVGAKIFPIKKYKQYSEDVSAAFEVAEKLSDKWDFAIVNNQNFRDYPNMHYGFRLQAIDEDAHIKTVFALGETAPLAICRAALLTWLNSGKINQQRARVR